MYAYATVGPTKLNPRSLRSLLNASDSGEVAGICRAAFQWLGLGRPPTKRQQYESKSPNPSWILRNARAFLTAPSIFIRFRIISGSYATPWIFLSYSLSPFSGSNLSDAR